MRLGEFRKRLPGLLPELMALVPDAEREAFLERMRDLLQRRGDVEIDPYLEQLFDGDERAVFQTLRILRGLQQTGEVGVILKDSPAPRKEARYVNTCFTYDQDTPPLNATMCLGAGRFYQLRIDIGALSPDSIVENPAGLPTDQLPSSETGHWLSVSVTSMDFEVDSQERSLFLPFEGSAWVCGCLPGGRHECEAETRSPFLYVPLTAPGAPGQASLRVIVAYRGGLLQSQHITADVRVREETGFGARARIDFTLGGVLNHVSGLPPRGMNIITERGVGGSHTLTIGGLDGEVISFNLTEAQMGNAMTAARMALRDLHMTAGRFPRNLLDARNGKSRSDLIADLARLAPVGRQLWNLMLASMPQQRRLLQKRMRLPLSIQVARANRTTFVFPWALVYDIPLEDGNPKAHHPCRFLTSLDPAVSPPGQCPYESEHRSNTLCPFGFWGFRHTIEQPPSLEGTRSMPILIRCNRPPEMVVGLGASLDGGVARRHISRLGELGNTLSPRPCTSRAEVVSALGKIDLPLVYFYCHGRREKVPGMPEPMPCLELAPGEKITPGDVTAWYDGFWSEDHWAEVSPLVFINSCHSVEITPDSLAQFVDAFVGADAAGVIGTETAVHQELAGEVAEVFWASFGRGDTVGQALAEVRSRLLSKGNLLGLAYTAYCSSDLRLFFL